MSEMLPRARRLLALVATLAGAAPLACVPLPVVVTQAVAGRVRDAKSGQPVAGAVVVVRFDARYDDLLPDRDVIAHRELLSGPDGGFALGRNAFPRFALWPLVRSETRVVGVIADGYRCSAPQLVSEGGVEIALAPALDDEDRRDSCRPLGARASEAPRYLAAWQALHPRSDTRAERDRARELERVLAARSTFGFGENCRGPVADLALSPDGHYVAWMLATGASGSVEIRTTAAPSARSAPVAVSETRGSRRLAWTSRNELLLWQPAGELDRALSPSRLSVRGGGTEVVWRDTGASQPPASIDRNGSPLPLEPADLRDEGDARWLGRSFQVKRALDPETGLARESLHIATGPRESHAIELPGEPCGPRGEFGLPQLRIAADTRTAFDLRHTGGSCGAVAIDLEMGGWSRLDGARGGTCETERQLPVTQLRTALRGYASDVEEALRKAGADPAAAFSLRRVTDGSWVAASVDYTGEMVRVPVPDLPIHTPLRRIEVGVIGSSRSTGSAPVPRNSSPRMEPL